MILRVALVMALVTFTLGALHPAPLVADEPERPRLMTVVKFKSKLSFEEVQRRYRERMPDFREVPGLVQKYYVHDPKTGEVSGIYLWSSKKALKGYLASDLKKTIAPTYQPQGKPDVQTFKIVDILRGKK